MEVHIGGKRSRERVLAKAERRAAARPVSLNVNREAVFDVGFACDEQIARAAVPVGENEINRVFVHHRDCQTAAIAASGVAFRLAFPRLLAASEQEFRGFAVACHARHGGERHDKLLGVLRVERHVLARLREVAGIRVGARVVDRIDISGLRAQRLHFAFQLRDLIQAYRIQRERHAQQRRAADGEYFPARERNAFVRRLRGRRSVYAVFLRRGGGEGRVRPQQRVDRYAEQPAQLHQVVHRRDGLVGLPFAHCLPGEAELFAERFLAELMVAPQSCDLFTCCHRAHLL